MNLLASIVALTLVGSNVNIAIRPEPPEAGMVLELVEFRVEGCTVSSRPATPGWTAGFDFWGGEVWYTFTRSESQASPFPEVLIRFDGCKPTFGQAWLWWSHPGPYGFVWRAECLTGAEYVGYRPSGRVDGDER